MKKSIHHVNQYDLSPLAKAGIIVQNMQRGRDKTEHDVFSAHRDSHFTLVVMTEGYVRFILDFEETILEAGTTLLIMPGVVHQIADFKEPAGWVIEFDPAAIDEDLQYNLSRYFSRSKSFNDTSVYFQQVKTLLTLMESVQKQPNNHKALCNLLNAALELLIAGEETTLIESNRQISRPLTITRSFENLLSRHYAEWKKPAKFAQALAVSVAHLNDTIKEMTGNTVSDHIQQRSILEAKRLLFFTQLSVKEVGYKAGYDEPVYFGKLFKKVSGMTPLQFRQKFRD
ncbi:AraC family transcriptional regulator [Mucilaginibacter gossypiicola]|nr:AraC family transcriptional regulator [Mucilaginibacter gossypiicola]